MAISVWNGYTYEIQLGRALPSMSMDFRHFQDAMHLLTLPRNQWNTLVLPRIVCNAKLRNYVGYSFCFWNLRKVMWYSVALWLRNSGSRTLCRVDEGLESLLADTQSKKINMQSIERKEEINLSFQLLNVSYQLLN